MIPCGISLISRLASRDDEACAETLHDGRNAARGDDGGTVVCVVQPMLPPRQTATAETEIQTAADLRRVAGPCHAIAEHSAVEHDTHRRHSLSLPRERAAVMLARARRGRSCGRGLQRDVMQHLNIPNQRRCRRRLQWQTRLAPQLQECRLCGCGACSRCVVSQWPAPQQRLLSSGLRPTKVSG